MEERHQEQNPLLSPVLMLGQPIITSIPVLLLGVKFAPLLPQFHGKQMLFQLLAAPFFLVGGFGVNANLFKRNKNN
jgi:hypothetical protein